MRPRNKTFRRGESNSSLTIFLWTIFGKLSQKKMSRLNFTKIVQADLDFLCQEPSNGTVGFVVAFFSGINLSCARTWGPIHLYRFSITKEEINVSVLTYCWYERARCYRAYTYQLDFVNYLNNPYKPRHLRRVRLQLNCQVVAHRDVVRTSS